MFAGLDLGQRQGLEELISAAPSSFDHGALFSTLQRCTLQHRMGDSFSCLVGPRWSALPPPPPPALNHKMEPDTEPLLTLL